MRTFREYDGMGGGKTRTIRSFWDQHGSNQWSYFDEGIKQHIEYFFSKRLTGKNLDLGGGWYLHYPDSDVVDVSPACLKYNIATKERKHCLDLDKIAEGKRLPFKDGTFDSATMISVWQYLPKPWPVVKEIQRVLKPGTELYLIDGEGAGVEELVVNNTHSSAIAKSFEEHGYDTLIEPIPDNQGGINGGGAFRSVCVAMPRGGKIAGKEAREYSVKHFNSDGFMKGFREHEVEVKISKLRELKEYPVTKYSRGLLEQIEEYSVDYEKETGDWPLFFLHYGTQVGFDMSLKEFDEHFEMEPLKLKKGESKDVDKLDEKYKKLRFAHCCGYLPGECNRTLDELEARLKEAVKYLSCTGYDEKRTDHVELVSKVIGFMAEPKLNGFGRKFDEKMNAILRPAGCVRLETRLRMGTADRLTFLAHQFKQRREVDELIARKKRLAKRPELVAGKGTLELGKYSVYFMDLMCDKRLQFSSEALPSTDVNQQRLDNFYPDDAP